MQYKAIIFDLFGTIVNNPSVSEYNDLISKISSILSLPLENFSQMWHKTSKQRAIGIFKTIEDCLVYICNTLKIKVESDEIKECVQLRLELMKKDMIPKAGAIVVISKLRKNDFKIGLISNCSADVPLLWKDTPFYPLFDTTIFSSSVGLKKPDSKIYILMCELLKVKPQNCLYIGDGDSNELDGASQVGMHAIRIRDPNDVDPFLLTEIRWNGDEISSLKDIFDYIQE
jgi:putative hydrolase of the HAD superfamily